MKEPASQKGYHDASIDPAQIDAWWSQNPAYNVGIALAPSKLVVLDVDVAKKQDPKTKEWKWKRGRKSLEKIDHELTQTLCAATGRLGEDGQPGMHAVYARPDDVAPGRVIGVIEKDSGLDLLGDGYIVVAPSFLAESGRYYEWSQLQPIAPLPPFLQRVAKAPRVQETVAVVGTPIGEGSRNDAMFRLGCSLRDTGIGREALASALDVENRERFTPPLHDSELVKIIDSIINTVQVRRDVAANAIVAQEVREIFAPPSASAWLCEVAKQPQPPVLFYPTGFEDLDKLLNGGFATRQLIGIIGPPSAGKSALVGHWLLALSKVRPVLHASLELTRHELFVRYAAHQMDFPWVDGIKGLVAQTAMASSVEGVRIRLFGADDAEVSDPLASIEAEAMRMRDETGITPIIAVDYVQLMARGDTEVRHTVGKLTKRLRSMAQRLDTVILGVLTTSRAQYGNKKNEEQMRASGDPTAYLAAAKESGDIEFDCATLMYFDVDKLAPGVVKPARIAVARVRVGEIGFAYLRAKLDTGTFWTDPSAANDFASEARAEARDNENMGLACERVLEAVQKMPGRPWRDIQSAVSAQRGTNYKTADRARDKLIGEGVLERVPRYDEMHRKLKGDALVIKEPPPSVEPPEVP